MSDQREENGLTGALDRAAHLLRDEPAPSAAWRDAVLRSAAADGARRWSVRPWVGIAACAACVLAGAALTYGVLRERGGAAAAATTAADGSVRPSPLPVRFAVEAPGAVHVSIVGDFNRWNPAGLPLHRMPDGRTWVVEVGLPPGRYAYAFVVDGRLARDPTAAESGADDFGVPNSVVLVGGS